MHLSIPFPSSSTTIIVSVVRPPANVLHKNPLLISAGSCGVSPVKWHVILVNFLFMIEWVSVVNPGPPSDEPIPQPHPSATVAGLVKPPPTPPP